MRQFCDSELVAGEMYFCVHDSMVYYLVAYESELRDGRFNFFDEHMVLLFPARKCSLIYKLQEFNMKTANELAQEYYAKTLMERLHTTLQDYIYNYQQNRIEEVKSFVDSYIERVRSDFDKYRHSDTRTTHDGSIIYDEFLGVLNNIRLKIK